MGSYKEKTTIFIFLVKIAFFFLKILRFSAPLLVPIKFSIIWGNFLAWLNNSCIRTSGKMKLLKHFMKSRWHLLLQVFSDKQCTKFWIKLQVADPYRWLEDPDSEETTKFVEEQNKLSQPFLQTGNEWQTLNTKLTKFWNYSKYSCPFKHGQKYFFFKNTGLQNQE
jgi:hypothetical protein